jgi:uncharacterized protein DUF2817
MDGGDSVSAPLAGTMWSAFYEECAGAEITPLAVEFGTQPLLAVLHALRAEQWLEVHADEASPDARAIKRGLRDAFHVDAPEWKDKVLAQALRTISQAIDGLAED